MSDLKQMQVQLQQYFLGDDESPVAKEIVDNAKVDAVTRLHVYADGYVARLVEALSVNYPFLQAHLGEDAFSHYAAEYVKTHPSSYRSIRWYGDKMAAFLQTKNSQLSAVAELDWAMTLVFDAEDAVLVTLDDVAQITPDQWPAMRFHLHPSVIRKDFYCNAVECWQQYKAGHDYQLETCAQATAWLFWRHEYLNKFISMAKPERLAVDAAIAGKNFAEICEELLECYAEEEVVMHAATMLKSWVAAGLIVGIYFKS